MDIKEIIILVLQKRASRQDYETLSHWLSEDGEHKKMFDQFVKDWYTLRVGLNHKTQDYNITFKDIMKKRVNRRISWKSCLSMAASISILIGLTLYLNQTSDTSNYNKSFKSANQNEVHLLLSSGEMVNLREDRLSIMGMDSKIKIDSSTMKYVANDNDKEVFHTLVVPRGKAYSLVLSDGTKVHLNSASSLKYPASFAAKKLRKVFLEGEAYFDVVKDENSPFEVVTSRGCTRVLGTEFNISAYKSDKAEFVTLVTGKVKVNNSQSDVLLEPGEQAELASEGTDITKKAVDISYYTSWRDGMMNFNNSSIKEVLHKLQREFVFQFKLQDSLIGDIKFSGTISKETEFKDVIDIIKEVTGVQVKDEGDELLFYIE